jgi:CRISPR-associated protein Cmr3
MTTTTQTHRFIEPLDVLFLRGNKLFGDPGSYGESLVPPWPSAAAGALRSRMLVDAGIDLAAFAQGQIAHPALGTPKAPGDFAVTAFDVARRLPDGTVQTLHPVPADLVLGEGAMPDTVTVRRVQPVAPMAGLLSSAPLAQWPVLPQDDRAKPVGGRWLTQRGWAAYLEGKTPPADQFVTTGALWQLDSRVGVGLDAETRRAADGKLFTVQAVAFRPGVGFLASVQGAQPPQAGLLRLGGDGRGAVLDIAKAYQPFQPDWAALARARRCRLVLTTPGLFAQGWALPGFDEVTRRVELPGLSARLVCATVPRAETVSGWDLVLRQPKPAQRVAPAGSVYWLDDLDTTPEALRNLAVRGLWPDGADNPSRRAEGFNRFTLAVF